MPVKEIKVLERRWFEESNKGKAAAMAVIDELHVTDYVFHSGTGEDIRGLKNYKQYIRRYYSAFPDLHLTIDDMVVEGDKVAIRWTMSGTHKGEIEGIPPTGKKMTIWGISIERVVGGKFVETWETYDTMGFMQQLGLVPTPGKG
jgi:steroid delta-isomerase-like uncharacterized protein